MCRDTESPAVSCVEGTEKRAEVQHRGKVWWSIGLWMWGDRMPACTCVNMWMCIETQLADACRMVYGDKDSKYLE